MTTRRSFSAQEKMEILNEGMQPGTTAVEVCRKHGIGASSTTNGRGTQNVE